jgi:hypothetical protein
MAEASTLLASSSDYEEVLKQVAKMAVPTIADWCSVGVLEKGRLSRTAVAHNDPNKLVFADEYSKLYPDVVRTDRGLGKVLETGSAHQRKVLRFHPPISAANGGTAKISAMKAYIDGK